MLNALFSLERGELDGIIVVYFSTGGTAAVEVLLDVVPTEATNLEETVRYCDIHRKWSKCGGCTPGSRKDKA